MAGIIGYIGVKNASEVIVESLRRLEYRGYDSAGIATLDAGSLYLCRAVGGLDVLIQETSRYPLSGTTGIGHLRWATHGVPSHANAHPHTDCEDRIAVVHNGMVENYVQLRKKLTARHIVFRSETDSEVIAQLIGFYLRRGAEHLEQAIHCALMDVKGAYAIAVIDKQEPDKIVAARNGSPLIIGLANTDKFITSDAPAILPYTKKVIFLDDYQMVVLDKKNVVVTTLSGTVVEKRASIIDWDVEEAQKDGYLHFMLKEIHEQPVMLKKILSLKLDFKQFNLKIEEMQAIRRRLLSAPQIIIQACGSSYHAGLIAHEIFEYFAAVHTDVAVSSEFRYKHLIAGPDALVLSISQSGETADVLAALRKARQKGLSTFSLCNVVGSSVSRESDAVLYIHAGAEVGVSSTKTYTAQLISLYLVGIFLGMLKKKIKRQLKDSLIKELTFVPSLMKKTLGEESHIKTLAEKYAHIENVFFLGRGINYPSALEGAHKLREISGIHASAYPAGEFKHGPIALINEQWLCVCIVPHSSTYEKMLSTIQKIKARHGQVLAVATAGDEEVGRYADDTVVIPKTQEIFSPLLVTILLQLFAYHLAVERRREVDRPRHLAKSVRVE